MTRAAANAGYRERGVAALEFALVFPIIFLLLYGLVTFGAVMFTQLAVSRAAQDGARAVSFLPPTVGTPDYEPIKSEVIESLAGSTIVPAGNNAQLTVRRAWLNAHVRSRITVIQGSCAAAAGSGTCVTVTVQFPYGNADGTRIFPSITLPLVGGTESWMPDVLASHATVRL